MVKELWRLKYTSIQRILGLITFRIFAQNVNLVTEL